MIPTCPLVLLAPLLALPQDPPPAAAKPAASDAPAAPQPAAFERPKYQFLRENENWSVLRGQPRGDFFDPIKYVPLTDDGDIWMSFGGSLRFRPEYWHNFNFGAPPTADTDDWFTLTRIMLNGDLHAGEHFRLYVEGKSALAHGRSLPGGTRTVDEDELDLQQLFFDASVGDPESARFTLRPGRQMLQFGKQRLVSPLPWANSLRSWDGVSGWLESGATTATGFWTQFVPVDPNAFNEPDSGQEFYGVYGTTKAIDALTVMDLYWLGFDHDMATFNGTSGAERRDTFGSRLAGVVEEARVDWEVEGAWQTGSLGGGSINAGMFASQVGWRPADDAEAPRLWVGFDWASGDDAPGGNVETFNQLYPLGHAYFGYIDTIGRQNIMDGSFGVGWKPVPKVGLGLGNHAFWVDSKNDAIYNAGGGVVRPGPFTSSYVGFESDLTLTYRFDRHFDVLLGYSHFFAGDAIEESGPSNDIDFVYLQFLYTF